MTPPWKPIAGETPIDLSGLRDRSIRTREELSRAEEECIRRPHVKYLAAPPSRRLAPFDSPWMRRLHQEMFGKVWEWAGEFRLVNLNLGCPWQHVPQQVHALAEDLNQWKATVPLLEQVARLHHRAVAIHPFPNGNGRWARLLATIWQYANKGGLTFWPEVKLGNTSPIRREYIRAVKAADEGDYEPLKKLHKRYTQLV